MRACKFGLVRRLFWDYRPHKLKKWLIQIWSFHLKRQAKNPIPAPKHLGSIVIGFFLRNNYNRIKMFGCLNRFFGLTLQVKKITRFASSTF